MGHKTNEAAKPEKTPLKTNVKSSELRKVNGADMEAILESQYFSAGLRIS
jgi:hypothetical protein